MKKILREIKDWCLWHLVLLPILRCFELYCFIYNYKWHLLVAATWLIIPLLNHWLFSASWFAVIIMYAIEIGFVLLYFICKISGLASKLEEDLEKQLK